MSHLAHHIIALYERHAHRWDARRSATAELELPWLTRFAALLPPGATVLDMGCGNGRPLAAWLAAQGHAITGVDSSPAMLALCRQRFPTQRWLQADMRALQLGQTFLGLLAWDSFFHLAADDQRRMFAVFRAHARPGTVLMFTSGPAYGEAIGEFEGEPLFHASLSPDEYRRLLAQAGFEVLAYVPEDPACGRHTVWLARCVEGVT
jgi:SAM-dependent methyltransferase